MHSSNMKYRVRLVDLIGVPKFERVLFDSTIDRLRLSRGRTCAGINSVPSLCEDATWTGLYWLQIDIDHIAIYKEPTYVE